MTHRKDIPFDKVADKVQLEVAYQLEEDLIYLTGMFSLDTLLARITANDPSLANDYVLVRKDRIRNVMHEIIFSLICMETTPIGFNPLAAFKYHMKSLEPDSISK